ncbi:MAG: pseudaminic acid synthase [bacterium]|nr:pseudaminic acid synthase [bacterium]
MRDISIGNRKVGSGHPCFVVAELSGNHLGKFDEAVSLIRVAKEAGADAVKLQTYTEDTITLNSDKEWFIVEGKDNPELWKNRTLYELYRKSKTPWDWQPKLKKVADELGIILFSSPFDETAVDFLEGLDVPCYKISAYEATDFVLLRKVAKTGKPVIISFGYSSEEEIEFALGTLRTFGAGGIVALHCVTGYAKQPDLEDMHLSSITDLSKRFAVVAGFSDNNAGIEIPLMAVASGASVIEKHIILDRSKGGPDAQFSLEPRELKEMISRIRALEAGKERVVVPEEALGVPHYGPTSALEEYNKRWRRSLFSGKDIKKGELLTKENVRDVRPAFGLETKYYDQVIGKRAAKDIEFATPLSWDLIS